MMFRITSWFKCIIALPNEITTTPCSPELSIKFSSSVESLFAGFVVTGPVTNTSMNNC